VLRFVQEEKASHDQTRRELAESEERCKKLNASLAETVSNLSKSTLASLLV
jgi:hypothetical protein